MVLFKKVQKQSWLLQAKHKMEHSEFDQMLTMLKASDDFRNVFAYPIMVKFQYNIDGTVG